MDVSGHADFDAHESVHRFEDHQTGLRAFIALHSTALGPAAGGCRRWVYTDETAAVSDVLRLSRCMTYKNAMAGLPFGGGKAVILADSRPKSMDMFRAFGRCVESLRGRYVTAEDVGVSTDDMLAVRSTTGYVSGLPQNGSAVGGDPSPWTALGVFLAIKLAVLREFAREELQGMTVAVQGVGRVGYHLCELLHKDGATLTVADVQPANLERAIRTFGATVVDPRNILLEPVDVLAPCALGGILDRTSIPSIRARIVAGAANNQLAEEGDGARLNDRGIVYLPDFVINAGGIVAVAREYLGQGTVDELREEVVRIPERMARILDAADGTNRSPHEVAKQMALENITTGGTAQIRPSTETWN